MAFAIIGAMDYETELLKENMIIKTVEQVAGLEFIQGTLESKKVVIVTSGIGKVNAALCAQILITRFESTHVINTGVAGAIDDILNVGDIVISTDLIEHDMDATGFGFQLGEVPRMDKWIYEADAFLLNTAYEAACSEIKNHKIYKGRIVSGDQFISSMDKKKFLVETFNPYATEMEGAAIAHVCMLNEVPFVVIRAMSDKADGSAHVSYEDFSREAAINSSQIIMQMLRSI